MNSIIIFLMIALITVLSIMLVKKVISQNKSIVENFEAHQHDRGLIVDLQKKLNELKN